MIRNPFVHDRVGQTAPTLLNCIQHSSAGRLSYAFINWNANAKQRTVKKIILHVILCRETIFLLASLMFCVKT